MRPCFFPNAAVRVELERDGGPAVKQMLVFAGALVIHEILSHLSLIKSHQRADAVPS